MSRSLLDYHYLEDGELNRLWYEENDPRARDAFQQRWWLGGDPIAGKDLLANYHTLFYHRCIERGLLAEEHQLPTFRRAAASLVREWPAEPIPKFEEVFLKHADRAIAEALKEHATPASDPKAEQKKRLEAALDRQGEVGTWLREWPSKGVDARSDEECERMLEGARQVLAALDGDAARNHPLVRTEEPPPSKLDESVAVPHYGAKPLFRFAHQAGELEKRELQHNEWCQPCRQRCVGALLLLNRMGELLGGPRHPLPSISPEFDQILQEESPGIPSVGESRGSRDAEAKGGGKGGLIAIGAVLVIVAVIVIVVLSQK